MKNRVTFTLDPEISHRAKAVARARGLSLSSLVQSLLSKEIGERVATSATVPFSTRWAGKMVVHKKNAERFLRLKRKHDL